MQKYFLIALIFVGCSTAKQLERATSKVEKYKKILGVKPCECNCPQTWNWGPYYGDRMPVTIDTSFILNYNDAGSILKTLKFDSTMPITTIMPATGIVRPYYRPVNYSDSGKIIYLNGQ